MSKISDELRDYCKKVLCYTHYYDKFWYLADRIDREMVELPKDADGVTIRVGDTLDGYGKTIEVVEMRYGRGGWVLISRDGSGYADTFAFAHRHAPTVEDVLQKLLEQAVGYSDAHTTVALNAIAEYSAKLQLRENK